jgi:hypothetical protein
MSGFCVSSEVFFSSFVTVGFLSFLIGCAVGFIVFLPGFIIAVAAFLYCNRLAKLFAAYSFRCFLMLLRNQKLIAPCLPPARHSSAGYSQQVLTYSTESRAAQANLYSLIAVPVPRVMSERFR